MTARHIVGFVLIPLVLLIAAWTIKTFAVWSFLGNLTVPWFCTALVIAVLVVAVTCLLLERPPAAVPAHHAVLVVVAVLLIIGVGLIVDMFAYGKPNDLLASIGGWIGFAVILSGVFWLPRVRDKASGA